MKRAYVALMAGALIFTATGCSVDVSDRVVTIGDNPTVKAYIQITQDEAKALMDSGENIAVVDVRRQNEYDEGHIPNAILIPNETIHREPPKELPDFEQKILVYCRSGNRSKQAAQNLANMGYSNVYEFGGINTWKYDIVTDDGAVPVTEPISEGETVTEITTSEPSPTALLSSTADIWLYDIDGEGCRYSFRYCNEDFSAYYTPDNWCILNSYKITNKTDIEIICQALAEVHPIHSADYTDWRTPQDMAYEWSQHNIAYSLLPDDSEWKESAKDVDIDPPDQGKSVYQIFKDRIKE